MTSVTFTVNTVTRTSTRYEPSANHDPDGNGTAIVVLAP
jgi:hypothetical protein